MSLKLGIDLGGTKIEGALLDGEGHEVFRHRVPTPAGDYAQTLDAIATVVDVLEAQAGLRLPSIGIGTPGAVSRATGLMKNCNSVCLNGRPLRSDLEVRLQKTVFLANDADCFTLSEAVDGAASAGHVVFGVILGTGVGGGITVGRELLCGPNAITGEWGHNPLPTRALALGAAKGLPSRVCHCGRADCVEAWLCGPGLAETHAGLGGERVTADVVATRSASGDVQAVQATALHAEQLALALAQVINILDPDVIVLGGGVSNVASLYREVPAHWGQAVFSDRVDTQLVRARYGAASGVRGAAWLCR